MPKDYRKVKALKGTIFDRELAGELYARQRRCGLFALHGIDPRAVAADSAKVEEIGPNKVRIHYLAIVIPEGEPTAFPQGTWCEHGGYKKRHKVKQVRHFDAVLMEVL